jgi:hypothetical protein
MFALYVFSLILGGGFLALSLMGGLFGAHGDLGGDAGGLHGDLGGAHVDAGALGGHLHADAGALHGHAVGGHGHEAGSYGSVVAKIFSVRTVTYSLFGFGAVGTLLTWLWAGRSPVVIGMLAIATGLVSGSLINLAFGWVRRSESGGLGAEEEWAGHTGRVKLPIAGSGGLVVVEKAGRTVELRALPHASALERGDPASWKNVVVVEMEHGVARVAPLDDEQLLKP